MVSHASTMVFPSKLFKKKIGLSLDFGSSIVKAIYTSLDEDKLNVHFVNFPRENYLEAFQFLKENVGNLLEPGAEIITCGIGVSVHKEELETILNVRVTNTSEMDRMMDGFMFLAKNHSMESFVHPKCETSKQDGAVMSKAVIDLWPVMNPEGRIQVWPYLDQENADLEQRWAQSDHRVEYPVIVALVGSRASTWKLEADGTYIQCGSNATAGRTFLGLASLLTEAEGFDELISLSIAGDSNNVDQLASAIPAGKKDSVYNTFPEVHCKCFAFGHGVNKTPKEFRREDLAAATMSLVAQSAAHDAFTWAMMCGIKQVFFIGGFASSDSSIRELMEKEFAFRSYANFKNHACDCHFVINGGHAAAFGALLKTLEVSY